MVTLHISFLLASGATWQPPKIDETDMVVVIYALHNRVAPVCLWPELCVQIARDRDNGSW